MKSCSFLPFGVYLPESIQNPEQPFVNRVVREAPAYEKHICDSNALPANAALAMGWRDRKWKTR